MLLPGIFQLLVAQAAEPQCDPSPRRMRPDHVVDETAVAGHKGIREFLPVLFRAGGDLVGIADLAAKVRHFSENAPSRVAMARKGWQRNHHDYSGTEIARFIVDLTRGDDVWKSAPWSAHVFSKLE